MVRDFKSWRKKDTSRASPNMESQKKGKDNADVLGDARSEGKSDKKRARDRERERGIARERTTTTTTTTTTTFLSDQKAIDWT